MLTEQTFNLAFIPCDVALLKFLCSLFYLLLITVVLLQVVPRFMLRILGQFASVLFAY